jgi:hypothetical protein
MSVSMIAVSLDCSDAAALAGFWAGLLEREVDAGANRDFASIGLAGAGPGSEAWMFHRVPESREPKRFKNRIHVDLGSGNVDKAVAHAVDLGAKRLGGFDEGGYKWTTLLDPAGNEFDIVAV